MKLDVDTQKTPFPLVSVNGEVDLYSSVVFQGAVMKVLESEWPGVTMDLGKMEYLDSSGVGVLIRILQRAKAKGKKIKVIGLDGTPVKVLKMCNVWELLVREGCLGDH